MIALALIGGGLAVAFVVFGARLIDANAWQRSLVGYRVLPPSKLTPDDVANWLATVAVLTHAPRGALLPPPPVVVEVIAGRDGIEHQLFVPERLMNAVLGGLRTSLPGVRLESLSKVARPEGVYRVAAQLRLVGRRQLSIERAERTSRAVLASLQPLHATESVRWQWIMCGAKTPVPVQINSSDSALPWWLEGTAPTDADELRSARAKQREPLLHVAGRLLVQADTRGQAYSIFGRAWGSSRMLNVPGARLVRAHWPSALVRRWVVQRSLPVVRWPATLNTKELAGLLGFPFGASPLPGVSTGVSRQLPPASTVPATGTVLADSTYPGLARPIAISRRDRTMHMWLCGPTGVGKSTLITNMVVQDAERGDGLAVVDPKGDLVRDILARLPASRRGDVIVIDPSDTAMPVGFNLLGAATTEAERELATDQVLYVLRQQWEAFWGPRTDAVLRAALLTLTHVPAPDGSAYTLCEIPEILTNQAFRRRVVGEPTVPASVRQFWHWFEGISDGERAQVIGPVLNKLGAFTQRTPLRLMLGQSTGVDLGRAMRERKIVLVPLGRGQLGAETAALVGSLLVAGLWQATLRRIAIPVEQRRPYWLYIDEAQEVVRLPVDVADMVAEARGYGLGMTFANQHLSQLPEPVRRALLSTVRSQIVFQVESDDARVLSRAFAPSLDEGDLRSLPAYEVAMRLCVNGQTSRPITGRTRPLGEPINDVDVLRRESRERYGTARLTVEEALRSRLAADVTYPTAFGRRRADGGRG